MRSLESSGAHFRASGLPGATRKCSAPGRASIGLGCVCDVVIVCPGKLHFLGVLHFVVVFFWLPPPVSARISGDRRFWVATPILGCRYGATVFGRLGAFLMVLRLPSCSTTGGDGARCVALRVSGMWDCSWQAWSSSGWRCFEPAEWWGTRRLGRRAVPSPASRPGGSGGSRGVHGRGCRPSGGRRGRCRRLISGGWRGAWVLPWIVFRSGGCPIAGSAGRQF